MEVGNSAIRRLKNRERKILAFKVPPFKTSTDFDFEPSEILYSIPELEGVKLLRVNGNREASENHGGGLGSSQEGPDGAGSGKGRVAGSEDEWGGGESKTPAKRKIGGKGAIGRERGKEPGNERWASAVGEGTWTRSPQAEGQIGEPGVARLQSGCGICSCPQQRIVPVGVEAVERVRAMARRELAAEVADVQGSPAPRRAGAHPTRGVL